MSPICKVQSSLLHALRKAELLSHRVRGFVAPHCLDQLFGRSFDDEGTRFKL